MLTDSAGKVGANNRTDDFDYADKAYMLQAGFMPLESDTRNIVSPAAGQAGSFAFPIDVSRVAIATANNAGAPTADMYYGDLGPGGFFGVTRVPSGGFVDNVLASRDDVSFASASDWNEFANSYLPLSVKDGDIKLTVMDDFDAPWWQDAVAAANDGMLTHFNTALKGRAAPKIAQDVFAASGEANEGQTR